MARNRQIRLAIFPAKPIRTFPPSVLATTPILLCWDNLDLGAHAVDQATLAESKVDFLLLNEIDVA